MRIIDFHTHLDRHWLGQPLPTAEAMVAAMDRFDVEASCVFTVMGFYGNCESHNEALVTETDRYPDRLIPFATVDPKDGPAAAEELEQRLSDARFRGVKLHPWLQAFAPSMLKETMTGLLRVAARHDAPVIFHDGTPPYCTTFQVAEVARWVPEATIILGHAGLADYVDAAAQLIRDVPNLYACFCGPRGGDLLHLVATGGADKVLFGSDFGAATWELLAERIDDVVEAGLTAAEAEQVFYGNAARLLQRRGGC
ncbi:MAG: amidohydrolase [Phycisphaerae bacterium]|nr:amidohydrolase [Phycisphaerae bacterium]